MPLGEQVQHLALTVGELRGARAQAAAHGLGQPGAGEGSGETAGVARGADHVEVGESLATKAEAPASMAPKSCSSPAYMVSTTRPISGSPAQGAHDIEPGAVGEPTW